MIPHWEAGRWRVLCVRPKGNPDTPDFMIPLLDEWIRALALHCNVTVVEQDFDLRELCEIVHPDLIIFEGFSLYRAVPLRIANARAHSSIPRVAFLNGDGFDTTRPLMYRAFEHYGPDTFFANGYEVTQLTPELGGQVHPLPQLTDGSIYRDYRLKKTIPVSVFGGLMGPAFYAWRYETVLRLQQRIPTLVYAHPGYSRPAQHSFAVHGEDYARLLNQSHFSLADTTRMQYLVRKHLEIPACGAILVSPDTRPLDEFGFADMRNCILGRGRELDDKIDAVSRDPLLYERIRQAGHALVHARHTHRHWRHIIDWFECWRTRKAGEMVVQLGLFGPYRAVPAKGVPAMPACQHLDNELTIVLRAACVAIHGGGALDAVEASLLDAATWHLFAEPWVLLGVIALLRGQPAAAREHFLRPAGLQAARHGWHKLPTDIAICFDPVELAWLLLVAWLTKDDVLLRLVEVQGRGVGHLALRRIRQMLDSTHHPGPHPPLRQLPNDRVSVHWLGQEDEPVWQALIRRILRANPMDAPCSQLAGTAADAPVAQGRAA